MEKKVLIIPDVHGRTFWKDVKETQDTPIVFLGDYLDPYTSVEGITPEIALENFKEILRFADENKDRVTLLYGNHDSYAFKNNEMCSCRHDYINYYDIVDLFNEYSHLFKMAYGLIVNNKQFLLSHAGVNPFWVHNHQEIFGENFNYTAEAFNSISTEDLNNCLCDVSNYRGGYSSAGSMVWTDIHEHVIDVKSLHLKESFSVPDNLVQVFGHTWLETPIKADCGLYNIYCLDTQEIFYIGEDGEIYKLKNDEQI